MATPQNPLLAAYRAQQTANQQPAPPSVIMPPDSSPSVAPLLPPEPGPRIVAPRGTIPADSAEQSRLLSSGSGISQIHSKIENSGFGQKHPFLGKLAGWAAQIPAMAADIGVSSVAPQITTLTPGTEYHHRALLNQDSRLLAQDYANQQKGAQAQAEQAQAGEAEAQTSNLENPPAQALPTSEGYYAFNPHTGEVKPISANGETLQPFIKPGNRQHVVLQGKDGQAMLGFVDPTSGVTTDAQGNVIPNPVPFEKPTATPAPPHITAMHNGVPHIMERDPKTGEYSIDRGEAQPNYGQQVLPTKTITAMVNGIPTILQYNPATGHYDKPAGTSASGAAGHEMFQAGAVVRDADSLISDLQANRENLGTLGAWVSKYGLNTPIADPKLAGLQAELRTFAALQPAMHGFRGGNALETFENIIGDLQKNPDATIASIRGIAKTASNINPELNQGTSGGETRQYQGHTYTKGADGQWHLQQK